MMTVSWKDCSGGVSHKTGFSSFFFVLEMIEVFSLMYVLGWEIDFIMYFLKLLHFFIIILFYPLSWFAIECLSIFLGQTDHVQSGKPWVEQLSCASHQFPPACLLLPVRPLLSVNLVLTRLTFPAAPSKANLFSMLLGVAHSGIVLSVLFWAWFFFPSLFPSPIPQIKIKLAQTQGLYKFCSSDSKAGKGETEQNPWS